MPVLHWRLLTAIEQAHVNTGERKCGLSMAAYVLWRRAPRLRCLHGLRNDFNQAQHLYGKPEEELDEQEGKKGGVHHQGASKLGSHRLYYSPPSYHHNDEDKGCPSSWQQSDRHIASSKNTLLDSAFNKRPEPEMPSATPHLSKPAPPDVIVDARSFHKCRPEYAKMTLDHTQRPDPIEWEEAQSLLQKVADLNGRMKPSDVCRSLLELSRLHPDKMPLLKRNQRFTVLLRYCVENLHHFTDLQLLEALQSFVWLDMPPSHAVLGLYEAALSSRANRMTLHQLLYAADLWRCIGRKVPQFLQHCYNSVHLHLAHIEVPELVQLLYIIGEGRHCLKHLIPPVHQLVMLHLEQLYPEEVGIICLGLFKSQTSISQSTVTSIADKAHSCVNRMSDFAVVNVLKYLRFSYLYHRPWMEAMSQEIPLRAPRMGVTGLMHVALACSAMHYRSDNILTAIAERVPSLVAHCRSKDSCKLLWAFGTLRFPPVHNPTFYSSLTDSLRQRKAEFQRYPEHLLTGLLGLAFVSHFPEDLIALALSPDFVKLALTLPQLAVNRDLFTLDGAVAMELPQWTGPRLNSGLREEITELLWQFAQSNICQKPEVQVAETTLQDLLGGEKFVWKRMILPHTRTIDLEVHIDSTGQPVPVNPLYNTTVSPPQNSSSAFTLRQGGGKREKGATITKELFLQLINTKSLPEPLTSSGKSAPQEAKSPVKLAIQVSSRNHYCCHSEELLGLHYMKRRHLKLAGYKVVELSYNEWFPMISKSRAEKLAYLHRKLYERL